MTLKPRFPLSPRQAEVLAGMLRGLSDKEIAKQTKMSTQTVKVHCKAIFNKLGVRSRTAAVITVMQAALELPCPKCGHVDKRGDDDET